MPRYVREPVESAAVIDQPMRADGADKTAQAVVTAPGGCVEHLRAVNRL